MSIIFKHIINAFLFLCIVKSSFLFSQTYNPQTQNRSWSANNSISTVFLKASGVDITITPNLNMIQFIDSNGDTYCLLYTSPSPRDRTRSRMPSSA